MVAAMAFVRKVAYLRAIFELVPGVLWVLFETTAPCELVEGAV